MHKRISGVILSYALIAADILVGILFVPFLLSNLGEVEYGLYKLMYSTASYLSVLDFGIGSTITRYVVKFRTEQNKAKEENFIAMGLLIYGVLAIIVILLALLIGALIPRIYATSIQPARMADAQKIFLLICANTSVNLFCHAYNGLLVAYERFTYNKLTNIIKIFLRVCLIFAGVRVNKSVFVIVNVDLLLSVALLFANVVFTKYYLKCRIKLHKWDFTLLREALVYTVAILAQSIINQFNSNVDNIVLGIFTTTSTVAIYSIALQLYTMYSNLSTAVSSIYLPSISKAVFLGEDDRRITEKVIAPSRMQLIVLLLALSGFLLFGQDFIFLWLGESCEEVYLFAMILMVSSTLQLSQNTITSVLKAKNILHGKTLILSLSTFANVVLTVLLVPRIGATGAALGTAFSMLFGYGICLNIYYQQKAGIDMRRFYSKTSSGIILAATLSIFAGAIIAKLVECNNYVDFIIEAGLYSGVYIGFMMLFGLNDKEKKFIGQTLKHIFWR